MFYWQPKDHLSRTLGNSVQRFNLIIKYIFSLFSRCSSLRPRNTHGPTTTAKEYQPRRMTSTDHNSLVFWFFGEGATNVGGVAMYSTKDMHQTTHIPICGELLDINYRIRHLPQLRNHFLMTQLKLESIQHQQPLLSV